MMAADSDGTDCYSVTTVVTCEGDLTDPKFPFQLEWVITKLQDLLGWKLFIRKLEPWNSVRVTLSIPREAAIRLRNLATEGAQQLRALGILSIQVEGDQVISLRLAGPEPQEIILRTAPPDGNSTSSSNGEAVLAQIIGESQLCSSSAPTPPPEKIQFRSPNVICPTDTVVPKVPSQNVASTSSLGNARSYTGPFPFTSMNQAIHSRDVTLGPNNYNSSQAQQSLPPPPYPGKNPPITISSPLLVNLLQNDGVSVKTSKTEPETTTLSTTIISPTTVSSSTVFKYSAVSLCAQDNALFRKTVTTKANAVLPSSTSQTIVQQLTSDINNSHFNSVLPLSSLVNQCNSTKAISKSPPLNHVVSSLHPPSTSLSMNHSSSHTSSYTSLTTNSGHTPVSSLLHNITGNNSQLHSSHIFTNTSLPFTVTTSAISISSAARQTNSKSSETLSIPNSVKSNLLSVTSSNILADSSKSINRNVMTFPSSFPPPPAYSSSCQFEPMGQPISQLLELTPSLTELKSTDLELILPSLESDIARSPPSIPEELTNVSDRCSYLINPLTGELEPHINSDIDEEGPADIFTGLPSSPNITSDEDTNSTCRPDTTDQSDSESRSNHSDSSKNSRLKTARNRERGRDSPNLKPTEKIKLRLKLEKSEPIISPAYKVDVSYITVSAKKPSNAVVATSEELRVPPLHISLKGRNHVVINNRKKFKNNLEESTSKLKVHKSQDSWKYKKNCTESVDQSTIIDDGVSSVSASPEQRRIKKIKTQDHREQNLMLDGNLLDKDMTKYPFSLYPKERRGSDSELAHPVKRYEDTNGIFPGDKKRRLSHTEQIDVEPQPHLFVLGSTNTGTVAALPTQKLRKDKLKLKDCPKLKELHRNKNFAKNLSDKLLMKQLVLPTGDMDMEAKFKQRLLEDVEKGIPRPPHRTENVPNLEIENSPNEVEHVNILSGPPTVKDKPPELNKNTTIENKNDLGEKQGRSPNSGGQGEDSGIESMDALSEKSPNQASQSPHTDITDSLKSKPQVPTILDIEAQLAKMEGLNGEDLNENKHNGNTALEQCCALTSALQDSLKQGTVSLTTLPLPSIKEQLPKVEVSLVALKPSLISEKDLDPTPVHISPPRYTYSNPDKHRDSDSPSLSDYDMNSCSLLIKNNNLLEQLLIHIPDNQNPSSPSPMTRSLRTRASSKLSSPELNSPVPSKQTRVPLVKRKRRESDSSVTSLDDLRNKKHRKSSESASDLTKICLVGDHSKLNVKKSKVVDDSSDSDEPLIEVAGKVRKNNINTTRTKFKASIFPPGTTKIAVPVKTRSSVRTIPALNTRSKGDKVQRNANALRRKTRSAVSEVEVKRRKAEVK